MQESSSKWTEDNLLCRPLDTYAEIADFLQDPPSWRSLCIDLKPHSANVIKNSEVHNKIEDISLENPLTFCHTYEDESDSRNVKRHPGKNLPKTLVCHDMANGYHDDCAVDGTGNYDAYTFYNWAGIDIFCYFSHHLVTIPPLGWINTGHAHGVKVIGTLITEWGEGIAFWNEILNSSTGSQNLASALVAIAKTLKFDGWLLNIENKVENTEKLLQFVDMLHKTLHQELPDAVLIWYDSVTMDGMLNWQNQLNQKNKAFFDVCDGFFTNYSWTKQNVEDSAAMAGDRLTDLYIGLDVWGRNFYGGGMFNLQEAIKVVHSYGCSMAIFAPAWTHEGEQDLSSSDIIELGLPLSRYERFLLRDRALWDSIWPYLNTRLPTSLPFQTSFCRGQGRKRRLYGEVLCPVPWYNLRHQQYQPNSAHGPHGYVLTTQIIVAKSSHSAVKDTCAAPAERNDITEDDQTTFNAKSDSVAAVHLADDDGSLSRQETASNEQIKKENRGSKMRNAFRNLFRFRTKSEGDEEEAERPPEAAESAAGAGREERSGTGQSMVQMPVQLKLGAGKTKLALTAVAEELQCLQVHFADSFTGGSCLKLNPSDRASSEHRRIRLLHCDFRVEGSLVACLATKTLKEAPRQHLDVQLVAESPCGGKGILLQLSGRPPAGSVPPPPPPHDVTVVYPLPLDGERFRDLQRYLLLEQPGFYVPVENAFGWKVMYYEVEALAGACVSAVWARPALAQGGVLLGLLGLCPGPSPRGHERTTSAAHVQVLSRESAIRLVLYSHTSSTSRKRLQVQQNISLRLIVGAGRYVRNDVIARDTGMETVDAFIKKLTTKMFRRADTSRHRHLRGIASLHTRPPEGIQFLDKFSLITTQN